MGALWQICKLVDFANGTGSCLGSDSEAKPGASPAPPSPLCQALGTCNERGSDAMRVWGKALLLFPQQHRIGNMQAPKS